jgi:hypothetical protein
MVTIGSDEDPRRRNTGQRRHQRFRPPQDDDYSSVERALRRVGYSTVDIPLDKNAWHSEQCRSAELNGYMYDILRCDLCRSMAASTRDTFGSFYSEPEPRAQRVLTAVCIILGMTAVVAWIIFGTQGGL